MNSTHQSFPKNIIKNNLIQAIKKIDREGIPNRAHSSTYDVIYNGKRYPPKLVVSYANIYANGHELNRSDFRGGKNTSAFELLEAKGFKIVDKVKKKSVTEKRATQTRIRVRKRSKDKRQGIEKRKGFKDYIVNLEHNKIQESFYKYLKSKYPNDDISMEDNFVDIKRENAKEIILYEVKSYDWAEDCIKEGLGQILSYSYQLKTKKIMKFIIVGPNKPEDDEYRFIKYLKGLISIDFNYINFSL